MTDTPTDLSDQSCDNCRFWGQLVLSDPGDKSKIWAPLGSENCVGMCCFNPPTIRSDTDINGFKGMGAWPRTYGYEWCGKWTDRPAETFE